MFLLSMSLAISVADAVPVQVPWWIRPFSTTLKLEAEWIVETTGSVHVALVRSELAASIVQFLPQTLM